MTQRVYYCGCRRQIGHFIWWKRDDGSLASALRPPSDWPKAFWDWDRAESRHEQAEGWSLVCALDNTVDTRGGSHSTVVAQGDYTAEELWALLVERFPEVHSRLVRGGVIRG